MSGAVQRVGIRDVEVLGFRRRLEEETGAVLMDVRTQAELVFVDPPDLTPIGKRHVTIEWQEFPDGTANASFVDQVLSELSALGAGPGTSLYLICRSESESACCAGDCGGGLSPVPQFCGRF